MKKSNLSKKYSIFLNINNIKKQSSQDIWAYPSYAHSIVADYGWKIHISAVVTNALEIAEKFLKLNKRYKLDFKIISSISNLEKLNMGYYGNSQVGKFITIYPPQDKVLNTLEILYYFFHNDIGIPVGSYFSYKLSSNVYYRFGTLLLDSRNIDKRDKQLKPFKDAETIPDYTLRHLHQLPSNYLILKVLKKMGPTGVFLGLDISTRKKVIIRYATKLYNLELSGIDENDRLLSTSSILNMNEIKNNSHYENIIDTFYVDTSVFLVTEYIDGRTLDEMALDGELDKLSNSQKMHIFNQMYSSITNLNKLGIMFRDISFNNVIITQKLELKIIDFNYAVSQSGLPNFGGRKVNPAGTYGFYNPVIQMKYHNSDKYGLAKFLYFLFYPKAYVQFISQIDIDTSYSRITDILKSVTCVPLPKEVDILYHSLLDEFIY